MAPPRTGRTRQQQREESHRRLLEAATSCLITHGLAGTTTATLAETAGLSPGALFNHFESKEELIAAAVEEAFQRLLDIAERALEPASRSSDRFADVVDRLWQVVERPEMQAVVEVYAGARTNDRLRQACRAIEPPYREQLQRLARRLFPDLAFHPKFRGFVEMTLAVVRGTALTRLSVGSSTYEDDARRALIEALSLSAEALVGGAAPTHT